MSATERQRKLSPSRIFLIASLVLIIGWIGMRITSPERATILAGARPAHLGVQTGQLAPCPETPNCVSSQSPDASHLISPLSWTRDPSEAIPQIEKIVKQIDRTQIITTTDTYLYAEFTSRWLGFVDDVEFVVNPEQKIIDVRSASRLGESDLGVNRQRIEQIREQLKALES